MEVLIFLCQHGGSQAVALGLKCCILSGRMLSFFLMEQHIFLES